jgi:hypothetical protein
MQDQVSSSVLASCAQQHPSRHHHHQCTRPPRHPASAAAPAGVGATSGSNAAGPSVGCGGCGYGTAAAACIVHSYEGSVKGCEKGVSGIWMRLRGDAGGAKIVSPPPPTLPLFERDMRPM